MKSFKSSLLSCGPSIFMKKSLYLNAIKLYLLPKCYTLFFYILFIYFGVVLWNFDLGQFVIRSMQKWARMSKDWRRGRVDMVAGNWRGAGASGRLFVPSTNQQTNTINYQIKVSHPCSMFMNVAANTYMREVIADSDGACSHLCLTLNRGSSRFWVND